MSQPAVEAAGRDASVLDLVIAAAESWKLLVFVPALAGLLALGLSFHSRPAGILQRFESSAVIAAPSELIVLLRSPRVMDPVITKAGLLKDSDGDLAVARNNLRLQLSVKNVAADLYELSLLRSKEGTAQDILQSLLVEFAAQSVPQGSTGSAMRRRLEVQRRILARLQATLDDFNQALLRRSTDTSSASAPENSIGWVMTSLIDSIEAREEAVLKLERQLAGFAEKDIVQAPLPERPLVGLSATRFAIITTLCAEIALLLFVFLRTKVLHIARAARTRLRASNSAVGSRR